VAAALFAPKGSKEEHLGCLGWLALFASTAGAALISLGASHGAATRGQPSLAGDLLVLISLVAALAWILLSKKLMLSHSPSAVSAYTILVGGAMLLPWVMGSWLMSPLTHARVAPPPFAQVSWTAWGALAFAGVMCTATTTLLWNWGIHHVPASRAGVFLNIEPALGSFLGVQLLGEHLGPYAWIGGGLILTAALTLTTQNHQPEPNILLE
jgi:drug/metabolite transporter (DMT)-like permease